MERAFREVDRSAPLVGLDVEGAAFLDVVRDVGDVHAEPVVPVLQPFKRDGVVEVPGVLAVDRHRRQGSEVGPALDVLRPHRCAQACRLGHRIFAVRVGQRVLTDDDSRVDARRVDRAEHFDDAPERRTGGRRPSRQLDDDHVARLGAAGVFLGHLDIGEHAPIERHDESPGGVVDVVAADERRVAAL